MPETRIILNFTIVIAARANGAFVD